MALDTERPGEPAPVQSAEPTRLDRRALWTARAHRGAQVLVFVAVLVGGSAVGAALAPPATARIGPLVTEVRVRPSLNPGVHVLLPPAGRVDFRTHLAPVAVEARVTEVDLEQARALVSSPKSLIALEATAPDALRGAVIRSAAQTTGCALLGVCVLSLLVYRRVWRRTAEAAAGLAGMLVVTGLGMAATFDADKFAQPTFTGLLSQAPYVSGQAASMLDRLESYRSGLADIVAGVTALYATSDRLPVIADERAEDLVTVLHVSDIHLNPLGFDLIDRLVSQFKVDVVVDTGDITTWGTDGESRTLSRVGSVGVPYVFVRGNHDSRRTQLAVAANHNAVVLDGDVAQVDGIVIAGIGDPRFTPDGGTATDPTPSGPGSSGPSTTPATTSSSSAAGASSGTASPSASEQGTPGAQTAGEDQPSPDPEVRAGQRLAGVIRDWNAAHPQQPVTMAAIHEPAAVPPLLGDVPLVLAGHVHTRSVKVQDGTRVMVEGSTGGAGITAGGLEALSGGDPLPLDATLLHIARSGPRAGQVVAYDEVTVGGFGLASVSLQRTVVRPGSDPARSQQTPAAPNPPAVVPRTSVRPS